ncbi:MAG TPA: sugar transferase [Dehalococcoidia bacterium]|jgi:lipopolysaccharide/colanic/teichoic acid biosynthesis glycosyltransferase|nr:sugar transferase [Dehalococcoidia bacterium]
MRSVITRDGETEQDVLITSAVLPAPPFVFTELGGAGYAIKGIVDRVGAALLLAVLAVPIGLVALAIKLTSPGPVFVRQVRVGRYGRTFTFYKFRSMRKDAELMRDGLEDANEHEAPTVFKMRRDPRVTPIGRFIRRASIDELPNLFNVIKGDMSLIGPRPPLPREVAHYEPRHMQRLAAMPGMTGLWQIRGRSEIPFEDMVEIDLEYIERWSLWLDLYIVLKTPFAVLGGRGAW